MGLDELLKDMENKFNVLGKRQGDEIIFEYSPLFLEYVPSCVKIDEENLGIMYSRYTHKHHYEWAFIYDRSGKELTQVKGSLHQKQNCAYGYDRDEAGETVRDTLKRLGEKAKYARELVIKVEHYQSYFSFGFDSRF